MPPMKARMKKVVRDMMKKRMMKPGDMAKEAAFHEVEHNEPKVVGSTRKKFGATRARKQKIAIALNKARKM